MKLLTNQFVYQMLNLIVTYIWIGSIVPEDYLISFSEVKYPVRILINPPNNYTHELDIQKADHYRLEFLRNGGLYVDFDTRMNYEKLMQKLSTFKGEMAAMNFLGEGWKLKVANGFIYVPPDNTSLVNQILEKEGKDCKKQVSTCMGPHMLQKYRDRITLLDLSDCVWHDFDFSWYKDSSSKPQEQFMNKYIKKQTIKKKALETENKLNQTEKKVSELNEKLENAQKEIKKYQTNKIGNVESENKIQQLSNALKKAQGQREQFQIKAKDAEIVEKEKKQLQTTAQKREQKIKQLQMKIGDGQEIKKKIKEYEQATESSKKQSLQLRNKIGSYEKQIKGIELYEKKIEQLEKKLETSQQVKYQLMINSNEKISQFKADAQVYMFERNILIVTVLLIGLVFVIVIRKIMEMKKKEPKSVNKDFEAITSNSGIDLQKKSERL